MDYQTVFDLLKRDAAAIHSEQQLFEKLRSGKKLRIKLGADPSRPDLHLGHCVVLNKLRLFQELGHDIIFVIGDFTGMIGDPSGRSKTRQPLTFEQTRQNGQTYFDQVTKILDKNRTTITYNSEWLSGMKFADVLDLAGKYTVARIIERDDFAKRFKQNAPIGLHELFYPLMQGYDSVALHADVEVGGSDQTFNLLVGRELQRDYGQIPQDIITFPLLPGLDGQQKMSKSLDNYIGLNEPPAVMFEKCMKIPDHVLGDYFRLTTDLTDVECMEILEGDARKAHMKYADIIVTRFCGQEASKIAYRRYMEVADGSTPEDIRTVIIHENCRTIAELVMAVGFAPSKSQARNLIKGRGIKINGQVIQSPEQEITEGMPMILCKGKHQFIRAIVENNSCPPDS